MSAPSHATKGTARTRLRVVARRATRPRNRKGAGRPRGAVSEETRARIIDAACACFAERGYSNASNHDIARAAGLTTGALYHYFESKAELFAAAHRYVQSVLLGAYQGAFAAQTTCVAQLCSGLEASLAVTRQHPKLAHFASIASLEIQRHPELAEILDQDSQGVRSFFARLLAAGRKRGEIAADIDLDAVVNLVVSSLFGLAWLRSQLEHEEEHVAAIRAFQRLLRGGLFQTHVRKK
jgi:AcrR family transcriptional regulator